MKSSIKLYFLFVFLTTSFSLAQELPPGPPMPKLPPLPPGREVDSQSKPEPNEPNMRTGRMLGDAEHQRPMGPAGQRIRHNIEQRENELLSWLDKNDPNKAKELRELKLKDQRGFNRRMMFEMRNYWQILEAEQSNPALAEVLKKDMALKQKRNELLDQLKAATDEKTKKELTDQLKDVLGQRFDLIVQKKQLRYEELKKKLEELQQDVKKSQAELETIKDKKEQQVQKHLEELLNRSEEIDWN
ncbi:MAG: hypothetical protein ABFD79_09435 [Phycisphaerales bacterium]